MERRWNLKGEEEKGKGTEVRPKRAEATVIHTLDAVLDDPLVFGKRVLDYLGIRGKRREDAERIIGKGGKEAERLPILLAGEEMNRERKWRWITFGLAFASILLSLCSALVTAFDLILSVIATLIRSGGPLR